MKNLWKVVLIVTGLALVVAACATAAAPSPAATDAPVVAPEPSEPPASIPANVPPEAEPPAIQNPVVVAYAVDTLPVMDGNAGDEQWKQAKYTQIGGMQWSAVYTKEDIALLIKWIDRDLRMNTMGNYKWDAATRTWSQYEAFAGAWKNGQEWANLTFDISSNAVAKEGCFAFCHEDPPGSGIFHHQTDTATGGYVDSWMLLGKHGFSQKKGEGGLENGDSYGLKGAGTMEDGGWLIANMGLEQKGNVVFDTNNTQDPHVVVAGNVTFIDYAEDNVMAPPGDAMDADRSRTRDLYCINCHQQIKLPYDPLKNDITYPDAGEIKYRGNWDVPYSAPSFMEIAPVNFADGMTITQTEVDSGEAVAIKDLTPEQITEYWANYQALNAAIPNLVLKEPDGSIADVLVAANWTDGIWTLEVTRKLTTPYGQDDVQFDDMSKDYPFSMSINNWDPVLGPYFWNIGAFLKFQPAALAQN
jgi:hypothetical protein